MDLMKMLSHMSPILWVVNGFMILMSIFSFYVVIERMRRFRRSRRESYAFVMELQKHLQQRRVDDAIKSARQYSGSSVAKVMEAGLSAYSRGKEALHHHGPDDVGDFDLVDSVNRALERVKERETTDLRKGLGALGTVASTAPFVGLFGTVLGIIGAFQKLSETKDAGGGGFDVVGPSISEALIATAVGLLVAIIAAIFFNMFTTRVENIVVDMNDVSSEFIDYVLKEGQN